MTTTTTTTGAVAVAAGAGLRLAGNRFDVDVLTRDPVPVADVTFTLAAEPSLPPGFADATATMVALLADLPPERRFTNGPALMFTVPPHAAGGGLHGELAPIGYYARALAAGNIPTDILTRLHTGWPTGLLTPGEWPARIVDYTHLVYPNPGYSVGVLAPDPTGVPHLVLQRRSMNVGVNPGVIVPSFSEGLEPVDCGPGLTAATGRGLLEELGALPCDPAATRIVATYLDRGPSRGYGLLGLLDVDVPVDVVLAARATAVDADENTAAFAVPVTVTGITDLLLDRPWGAVWPPTLLLTLRALEIAAGPGAVADLEDQLTRAGWGPGYTPAAAA